MKMPIKLNGLTPFLIFELIDLFRSLILIFLQHNDTSIKIVQNIQVLLSIATFFSIFLLVMRDICSIQIVLSCVQLGSIVLSGLNVIFTNIDSELFMQAKLIEIVRQLILFECMKLGWPHTQNRLILLHQMLRDCFLLIIITIPFNPTLSVTVFTYSILYLTSTIIQNTSTANSTDFSMNSHHKESIQTPVLETFKFCKNGVSNQEDFIQPPITHLNQSQPPFTYNGGNFESQNKYFQQVFKASSLDNKPKQTSNLYNYEESSSSHLQLLEKSDICKSNNNQQQQDYVLEPDYDHQSSNSQLQCNQKIKKIKKGFNKSRAISITSRPNHTNIFTKRQAYNDSPIRLIVENISLGILTFDVIIQNYY